MCVFSTYKLFSGGLCIFSWGKDSVLLGWAVIAKRSLVVRAVS